MATHEKKDLREHLLWLLQGGDAHVTFENAIADLPLEFWGQTPTEDLHTPWQLLEHMRIAQWDILEFSRNPDHVSPVFPRGYWPAKKGPEDEIAIENSVNAFNKDAQDIEQLVADPASDLFTPFPWGTGQTLLREALLVADHNAYHIGQLIAVRKGLNQWNS